MRLRAVNTMRITSLPARTGSSDRVPRDAAQQKSRVRDAAFLIGARRRYRHSTLVIS
jgi:hypothetical protein